MCALDVIVPRPSTNINAKRISITRIYFAFFWGVEMTDWMSFGSFGYPKHTFCRITTCDEGCINRVHLTFSLYTNRQNRPCGKEFNTTAFVNLFICNVSRTLDFLNALASRSRCLIRYTHFKSRSRCINWVVGDSFYSTIF
jgi:hypothetical protein